MAYYPQAELNLNIARGLVKGTTFNHKFGAVPALSINVTGTVWDVNDTVYPWATYTAADVVNIERNSASDDGKQVTIQGLDADYNFVEETITISGADTAGTTEFLRVNRAFVEDGATNVGNIDIEYGAAGGTTIARITAGKGQTLMAVYTIPAGYTGYLAKGTCSVQSGGSASGDMMVRYFGQDSFRVGHSFEVTATGGQYLYEFAVPIPIPEKSDIDVRAKAAGNNSRITAAFDIILIKNGIAS